MSALQISPMKLRPLLLLLLLSVSLLIARCSCMAYFEQYAEYDPFITPPECFSPWISDTTEFWEQEATLYVFQGRKQDLLTLGLTLEVHWGDHDLLDYYTFVLQTADDAENVRVDTACGKDHDH